MPTQLLGLILGAIFGACLFLAGLADPDKILGTLRLKDFHALRVIVVFLLVGMLGTWILDLAGVAHLSIKPAVILPVLLGGALLGVGFGLTGYCPGTGLACAAGGRIDALVTVLGMFAGALAFIWIHPHLVPAMESIADYGKTTLPGITKTKPVYWVVPIVVVGVILLGLTRSRKSKSTASA